MTKLTEWLTVLAILVSIWWMLLTKKIETDFTKQNEHLILLAPVYTLLAIGVLSAFVVLYRVFTFNDCTEAADSLRTEMLEATEDLKRLGFTFKR